jgi:hypothetical protein
MRRIYQQFTVPVAPITEIWEKIPWLIGKKKTVVVVKNFSVADPELKTKAKYTILDSPPAVSSAWLF